MKSRRLAAITTRSSVLTSCSSRLGPVLDATDGEFSQYFGCVIELSADTDGHVRIQSHEPQFDFEIRISDTDRLPVSHYTLLYSESDAHVQVAGYHSSGQYSSGFLKSTPEELEEILSEFTTAGDRAIGVLGFLGILTFVVSAAPTSRLYANVIQDAGGQNDTQLDRETDTISVAPGASMVGSTDFTSTNDFQPSAEVTFGEALTCGENDSVFRSAFLMLAQVRVITVWTSSLPHRLTLERITWCWLLVPRPRLLENRFPRTGRNIVGYTDNVRFLERSVSAV